MEQLQVLRELARIQLKLKVVRDVMKLSMQVWFDIDDNHASMCPRCHARTFQTVRVYIPPINKRALRLFEKQEERLFGVDARFGLIREFQIVDGICTGCGYDWSDVLQKIDRDVLDQALMCGCPELRHDQPCPRCGRHTFRGIFRKGGVCSSGQCVACDATIVPPLAFQRWIQEAQDVEATLVSNEETLEQILEHATTKKEV